MRRRGYVGLAGFGLFLWISCSVIYFVSEARLQAVGELADITLPKLPRSEALERGRHLGEVVSQCTFCHGSDWGGVEIVDDPIVGRLHSSNLTSGAGGVANHYRDEDFARAIRHGVGPAGENLWFMPSEHFAALSDEDLAALILYIRSLPPVDRRAPQRWPGPATRLAVALDLAPELVPREPVALPGARHSPTPSDAEHFGAYLVSAAICGTCHAKDLKGGRHPLAPPHEPVPPDLTRSGALASWREADFIKTMRTGITPDGRILSARYMPWVGYGKMSDQELAAIWQHLRRLDPTTAQPASSLSAVSAAPAL